MKMLEMFSGIGGFRYGMEAAGFKFDWVGFSEIDKYASECYKNHWTGSEELGDATTINVSRLPKIDILVGGFPCQAFSIAGKRKGFEDTRGTLFFEIARIAKAKRVPLIFLENVRGLLSHDEGRTFKTIIRTLNELGYIVQWQVLNSKDHRVPQNRERVFIVGHLGKERFRKVFPIGENITRTTERTKQPTVNTLTAGGHSGGMHSSMTLLELTKDKSQGYRIYDADGLSTTIASGAGGIGAKTGLYMVKEATKKGYAEAGPGDSINFSVPDSKTRRGRVGVGVANTLDTSCSQGVINDHRIRRLTPVECERLQGFPDNWTEGFSDTQRYKMCGNAVTTNVIKDIALTLL